MSNNQPPATPTKEANGELVDFTLQFDESELVLKEEFIRIGKKRYLLRQADEGGCTQYRNAGIACARLDSETGKPDRIEGLAALQPLLVSLCLHEEIKGQWQRVSITVVKTWPGPVVKKIFERAKEISDLAEAPVSLEALKTQRDKLNEQIAKMEAAEEELGKSADDTQDTSA